MFPFRVDFEDYSPNFGDFFSSTLKSSRTFGYFESPFDMKLALSGKKKKYEDGLLKIRQIINQKESGVNKIT